MHQINVEWAIVNVLHCIVYKEKCAYKHFVCNIACLLVTVYSNIDLFCAVCIIYVINWYDEDTSPQEAD